MIVTCTETVAAAIGTTSHADVVVMAYTCLIVQILPVSADVIAFIQRVLIQTGILTELAIRRTVHHRVLMEHLLEAHVAIIGHLGGSALIALHGGDDDHTVGTTGTVDGRCRSILQNIHRLDVGGIDIRKLSHEGDTVEHDQRVVTCTQ